MQRYVVSSILILIITILITTPSQVDADSRGVAAIREYLDLIVSGNLESAEYSWSEEVLERAERFGIKYDNILLKVDCNSPIIRDLPTMRDYLEPPVKRHEKLVSGQYYKFEYSAVVNGKSVSHDFYTHFDGAYHWLIHPQHYYFRDWPEIESKYLRIHADPSVREYLNESALREADRFIEKTAKLLSISDEDIARLAELKIEYYYCASDSAVGLIFEQPTTGGHYLPTDEIISSFFPHFHELSHFLLTYRLRELPLFTLPMIQEGAAVHLGGRWGKAPEALRDLGMFLYQDSIVSLDSLLSVDGFRNAAVSDVAYPVAGIFVSYLIDRLKMKGFLEFYRDCSGSINFLEELDIEAVQIKLAETLRKKSWADVRKGFDGYLGKLKKDYAVALPGVMKKGRPVLELDGVTVTQRKGWVGFTFTAEPGQEVAGNLLFAPDAELTKAVSFLFSEQYGTEVPFEGYRYGVRLDQNEAGLYDYATNCLLAKYIWGITPSDDYFDKENNSVSVMFRNELFDGKMPTAENCRVLPD